MKKLRAIFACCLQLLAIGCSRPDKASSQPKATDKTITTVGNPETKIAKKASARNDTERLAGEWLLDSIGEGPKLTWMESKRLRLEDGEARFVSADETTVIKKYLASAADDPMTLDFVETSGAYLRQLGIYEFDGEDLLLSQGALESPRPRSIQEGSITRYRRMNSHEKALLSGNTPENTWISEGSPNLGWILRFPTRPTGQKNGDSFARSIRLKANSYAFIRHFAFNETQEECLQRIAAPFGRIVEQSEENPKVGTWSMNLIVMNDGSKQFHRIRLIRSNYALYEIRVGSTKEFVDSPDAQRFLQSFRLADSEDKLADLVKTLFGDDRATLKQAMEALNNIDGNKLVQSENARKAIPEMVKVLLGPDNLSSYDDGSRRVAVYRILYCMGQTAEPAAGGLIEGLTNKDRDTRQSCFALLQGLKLDWSGSERLQLALPSLGKAVGCPEGEIRNWVSASISRQGKKALAAAPGLLEVMTGSQEFYPRQLAATLLGEINAKDEGVYRGLIERLGDPEFTVREAADASLRTLGPGSIQGLIDGAKRRDWPGREGAIRTLSHFGELAKDSIPIAIVAMEDRELYIRQAAAMLLGKIGPAASKATPELIRAIDDEQGPVRRAAAEALGLIGPAARDALPALQMMSMRPELFQGQEIARKAIKLIEGK